MSVGSKWLFTLMLSLASCMAQAQLKVYYLIVGSADYEHNSRNFKEKDFIPYDDLPEANASAAIMAKVLGRYAGGKGITLYSSPRSMITKQKLLRGMDSLERLIRNEKPSNPFIIIYYCGHGISENLGWNQFLVPGNYTAVAGNKSFDALGKSLVHIGDITGTLDKNKQRYMVLIDCCRKEEKDNSLPEARLRYFFSNQNVETFKTVVVALKYLNEYHQPNPVVFSIAPGNMAPTADVPFEGKIGDEQFSGNTQIGPVCRRTLIVLQDALLRKEAFCSLDQFVKRLTDPGLDEHSSTSVSYYEGDNLGNRRLLNLK